MKNSLLPIVKELLYRNEIVYDKKELYFQIESHPSYPSLHAITGVLDHFNIENIAAEVPTDITTLQQLPDCFIAQVSTEKGNDLVTVSKKNKQYLITSNNDKEKISETDFLLRFTGIIVAVEENTNPASVQNSAKLKNILLFSFLIISLGALLINKNIQLYNYSFLLLSLIGIVLSYSILKQELGENSVIGDAFCSSSNEKKDCDAVLNSKGAQIIKNHKLSDMSLIYFSGLLLSGLLTSNFNILYFISYLALPITFYSIYYQYKIVKSWCLLCLSIVSVLWLQTLTAYLANSDLNTLFNININTSNILTLIVSFTAIYLVWSFIKPLVKNTIELQKDKIEYTKFKRNFNLFDTLLKKSPKINTSIENANEIIFGNRNAPVEMVIVTNPFCGHCKPVHKTINNILARYNDTVKITIRFNASIDNTEDPVTIITSRLIELYNTNESDCKNAMDDIYGGMKVTDWVTKWEKTSNFDFVSKTLQLEKEWCTENAINFTPEILINGKSFPKEYKREDLLFFIEDLAENNTLVVNNI